MKLPLFLSSAVLSAVLAWSPLSLALSQRYSATDCHVDAKPWNTDFVYNAQIANLISGRLYLYCPVQDDDRFPKTAITTLNVHAYDGQMLASLPITAAACVSYWSTAGGTCGTAASTNGTVANPTLSPSLSAWSSAADFGYLYVSLEQTSGGTSSNSPALRGFFTAD